MRTSRFSLTRCLAGVFLLAMGWSVQGLEAGPQVAMAHPRPPANAATPPTDAPPALARKAWGRVRVANVNVRWGPGLKHGIITVLRGGDFVRILEQSNGWYRIAWPSSAPAWICSDFVQPDGQVTGNRVRIRAGGTPKSPILGHVNKTDRVEIISSAGNWYKIKPPTGADAFIFAKLVIPGVEPPQDIAPVEPAPEAATAPEAPTTTARANTATPNVQQEPEEAPSMVTPAVSAPVVAEPESVPPVSTTEEPATVQETPVAEPETNIEVPTAQPEPVVEAVQTKNVPPEEDRAVATAEPVEHDAVQEEPQTERPVEPETQPEPEVSTPVAQEPTVEAMAVAHVQPPEEAAEEPAMPLAGAAVDPVASTQEPSVQADPVSPAPEETATQPLPEVPAPGPTETSTNPALPVPSEEPEAKTPAVPSNRAPEITFVRVEQTVSLPEPEPVAAPVTALPAPQVQEPAPEPKSRPMLPSPKGLEDLEPKVSPRNTARGYGEPSRASRMAMETLVEVVPAASIVRPTTVEPHFIVVPVEVRAAADRDEFGELLPPPTFVRARIDPKEVPHAPSAPPGLLAKPEMLRASAPLVFRLPGRADLTEEFVFINGKIEAASQQDPSSTYKHHLVNGGTTLKVRSADPKLNLDLFVGRHVEVLARCTSSPRELQVAALHPVE